jgi:hypothetical protein
VTVHADELASPSARRVGTRVKSTDDHHLVSVRFGVRVRHSARSSVGARIRVSVRVRVSARIRVSVRRGGGCRISGECGRRCACGCGFTRKFAPRVDAPAFGSYGCMPHRHD